MTDHHTERDPSSEGAYPPTPDGRYFVVHGRLRQLSNPALPEEERAALVAELMAARRAVRGSGRRGRGDRRGQATGRRRQGALGERGPVWWDDGAPDYNRRMVEGTPYGEWYAGLPRWHSK